jgi:hypothetical protein
MEHRAQLGDRGRHHADPGRARLRDRAVAAARGEKPIAVERMMRDYRINKIFEGSSEIMHLFMAREAVDKHLQVAGASSIPRSRSAEARRAARRWRRSMLVVPVRVAGLGRWPRYAEFGPWPRTSGLSSGCRKLARQSFHGMLVYPGRLQNKQAFLFRLVDVANELFAMAATITRAKALADAGGAEAREVRELADLFCRSARRKVRRLFHDLWSNDDVAKYKTALHVLDGRHLFVEAGIIGLDAPEKEPAGSGPRNDARWRWVSRSAAASPPRLPRNRRHEARSRLPPVTPSRAVRIYQVQP